MTIYNSFADPCAICFTTRRSISIGFAPEIKYLLLKIGAGTPLNPYWRAVSMSACAMRSWVGSSNAAPNASRL